MSMKSSRLARVSALVWASLGALAPAAHAEDGAALRPPRIAVRAPACREVPWSDEAWVAIVRVELAADGIVVVLAAPSPDTDPSIALDPVTCAASADSATLTFTFGDAQRSRAVTLSDVEPKARARVLAIAAADLVRTALTTTRADLRATPSTPASTPPPLHLDIDVRVHIEPPRLPARREPESPPSPSFDLSLAAEARSFPQGHAGLFGARGGVRLSPFRGSSLTVDGGELVGQARDSLGEVDENLASLGVSLVALGGTAGTAFGVGPRIEGGIAWFRGHAFDPSTIASRVSAPVVFLAVTGFASFRIAGPWSGLIELDAGTSVAHYNARADDRDVASFAGALLSLRTGLLWTP